MLAAVVNFLPKKKVVNLSYWTHLAVMQFVTPVRLIYRDSHQHCLITTYSDSDQRKKKKQLQSTFAFKVKSSHTFQR